MTEILNQEDQDEAETLGEPETETSDTESEEE